MNKDKYNNQKITDYLLDSLEEEEKEQFDELSFTDESFVEQMNVVEKDLIDDYVNGELLGEQLKQFETYYLASPMRREKVEFAKLFQVFAEKEKSEENSNEKILAENKSKNVSSDSFNIFDVFRNPKLLMQMGFVSILLLVVGLVIWLLVNNYQPKNSEIVKKTPTPQIKITPKQLPTQQSTKESLTNTNEVVTQTPTPKVLPTEEKTVEPKPNATLPKKTPTQTPNTLPRITVATFTLTPQMRGTNQLKRLAISPQTKTIAMRLQLEFDEFLTYTTSLVDQSSGKTLWQSSLLKSDKSGENIAINIQFPAKLLQNKIYTIKVSGINKEGKSESFGNYPFQAMIK